MRLWLAFRCFFKILADGGFAGNCRRALESGEPERETPSPAIAGPEAVRPTPPAPRPPARNDAITLLETLQREARLIDLVMESLQGYTDAQVGAAARDVLRDSRAVLDRLFALEPLTEAAEGSEIASPREPDAHAYRFTGNVQGDPPYRGRVTHHGWKATRCELPTWNGNPESARVVAPVEMEVLA